MKYLKMVIFTIFEKNYYVYISYLQIIIVSFHA